MASKTKFHTSPDGTRWTVTVEAPGASNAMILFRHPDGASSRRDRYNWIINKGPEARSVTARLKRETVLDQLQPEEITRLFARSMPVSRRSDLNDGPELVRA